MQSTDFGPIVSPILNSPGPRQRMAHGGHHHKPVHEVEHSVTVVIPLTPELKQRVLGALAKLSLIRAARRQALLRAMAGA